MKKFKLIVVATFIIAAYLALVACVSRPKAPIVTDKMLEKYNVLLSTEDAFVFQASNSALTIAQDSTLKDYLDALTDVGVLTYGVTQSKYGFMIDTVNGKTAGIGEFWAIYTNDEAYSFAEWGTFEHEGNVLGSASFGADSLPLCNGKLYALALEKY